MSAILQHLNTLTTVYMTNTFNTGNRMLDNSLVAIAAILIGNIVNYLTANWRTFYNACIYTLYKMGNHPFAIAKAPYVYETKLPFTKDDFIREFQYCELRFEKGCHVDSSGTHIKKIIDTNNLTRMYTKDGVALKISESAFAVLNTHVTNGVYLIYITRSGECVYYSSSDHAFYSKHMPSLYETVLLFRRYMEQKLKVSHAPRPTNLIQSPVFDKDGRITLTSAGTLTSVGTISAKKTFDSLFYEEKATLIHLLEKFKAGTMYPAHVPMDNKLGILLYGPPGTGKTGTISAIANMLQRNIVLVNFTQITKGKELDVVFEKAAVKESIFVFDEFDCILDALGKKDDTDMRSKNDWGGMLLAAEGEERKEILSMMRNGLGRTADASIDLAYLLQKLDGLVSAEGRVIIATTNHPDKINPALLRPGRFDLKLCLGNCTHKMVADILEYYYAGAEAGATNIRETIMRIPIPDGVISPLELMNRAMQAPSFGALVKELKTWKWQLAPGA